MFLATITLLTAIYISSISAYFSIIGLAAIFSASRLSIIIMATSIELGKLVCAVWIKANWKNKFVPWFHKLYLILALLVCMSISSLGIFGVLSKAHFEQKAPIQSDIIKLNNYQDTIDLKKQQLETLNKQLSELNKTIVPGQRQFSLEQERRDTVKAIQQTSSELEKLTFNRIINQENVSKVEIEIGPIKYFADLIFDNPAENLDKAVQILILMIMFVFDPLAIVLLISAYISLQQYKIKKTEKKSSKQENNITETFVDILDPAPVVEEIEKSNRFKGLKVPKKDQDKNKF